MREISVEAEQVKRSSISDLRTAARNEGIFGEESDEAEQKFPSLEKKYTCIIEDTTLTIKLPENTQKEILMEIKTLLETYQPGHYHVWLDIGGKMIDTKKNIGE